MHLWDATERIRVLYVNLLLTGYLTTFENLQQMFCRVELSLMRTYDMHGMMEWFYASIVCVERHRCDVVSPVT